jgi:hypothetical protein
MSILRQLAVAALVLLLCDGCAWAQGQQRAPGAAPAVVEPWVHGTNVALRAYARASDAYTANQLGSVALWAVLIAAGLVLLEWLIARRRRPQP